MYGKNNILSQLSPYVLLNLGKYYPPPWIIKNAHTNLQGLQKNVHCIRFILYYFM